MVDTTSKHQRNSVIPEVFFMVIAGGLGVTDAGFAAAPADSSGGEDASRRPPGGNGKERDRAAAWLRNAMIALAVLAMAAAVVSWTAQYRMVLAVKQLPVIAALEAGIPDAGAVIFASLGIALALHGKRAIRARVLNVACVGTSVGMNALAAGHGFRDVAVWVMPPLAYALASDTLIGVIRAWTVARQKALSEALADVTPAAIAGGLLLWLLRLALAPASTLAGFRRWVIEECPVAPGRRVPALALPAPATAKAITSRRPASERPARETGTRPDTKTARFLALVAEKHGPLADFSLRDVSRVCTALAPEADLDPGAARSALRKHVQSLRNGGTA
jgi:hypothetical protein